VSRLTEEILDILLDAYFNNDEVNERIDRIVRERDTSKGDRTHETSPNT